MYFYPNIEKRTKMLVNNVGKRNKKGQKVVGKRTYGENEDVNEYKFIDSLS